MIPYLTKRPGMTIATIVVIGFIFFSRQWILSDLNTPSYQNTSSVSILFHSPHLNSGLAVYNSLRTDTRITEDMDGLIESKACTMPFIGLRYIKISAPSEKIQQITQAASTHIASRYPMLTPKFSYSAADR